jgi:hypothetical protein
MEILLGFALLFGMWLLGKFFDRKIEEHNAEKEKVQLVQYVSEDPTKIVQLLRQQLKELAFSKREVRLARNTSILPKYLKEMDILCQCAQFFVIDQLVLNLQIRGPLISAFKAVNGLAYENKYSAYRDAYLNNPKLLGLEFLKALELSGASAIAIDPVIASDRFHAVCGGARELLKKVEMA